MKDSSKTKQELIEELSILKKKIKKLQLSESDRKSAKKSLPDRKQIGAALPEGENKYRLIAENTADLISIMDMNLHLTYVSPTSMRLRGFTVEEAMEQTPQQILTPESLRLSLAVFEEEMQLEASGTADPNRTRIMEVEEYKKDGSTIWVEVSFSLLRDKDGKPVEILMVTRNISDRKRAEEALQESKRRLSEAQKMAQLGHWIWDIRTGNVEWSEEILNIFRLDPKEFTPNIDSILALSPWPEDHERDKELIRRAMENHEKGTYEQRFLRPDNSIGYYHSTFQGKYDDGDNLISIVGTVQDTTDRKRAQDDLKVAMEKYHSLVISVDSTYLVDKDYTYLFMNDNHLKRFGLSLEEVIGKRYSEFHSEDDSRTFAECIDEVCKTGNPITKEHRSERDGIFFLRTFTPIMALNPEGKISQVTVYSKDITKIRTSEKQLIDTLESLRKAFGAIVQIIVSIVESRDPYTAGHQIRVADLARAIATEVELPQDKIEGIRMAGSIHDIGKLSIPAEILSKPTKLTNLEFSLIKEHSRKGYEMLKDVESPWPLAELVYQHHERMDGSGYPRNLKGDEILMEARILAVADVVEAMASHRPYRPGLGIDAALNEIEKNRGIFYDKAVVDACLKLFREKEFKLEGT